MSVMSRFVPKLEALEDRFAPSCSYEPQEPCDPECVVVCEEEDSPMEEDPVEMGTVTVNDYTVNEDQQVTVTVAGMDAGTYVVYLKKDNAIVHQYPNRITVDANGDGTITFNVPHLNQLPDAYQIEINGVLSSNMTVDNGNAVDGMYLVSTDATQMWMATNDYTQSATGTLQFKIWTNESLNDKNIQIGLYHDGGLVQNLVASATAGNDNYYETNLAIGEVLPANVNEDGYEIRVTIDGVTSIHRITIRRAS